MRNRFIKTYVGYITNRSNIHTFQRTFAVFFISNRDCQCPVRLKCLCLWSVLIQKVVCVGFLGVLPFPPTFFIPLIYLYGLSQSYPKVLQINSNSNLHSESRLIGVYFDPHLLQRMSGNPLLGKYIANPFHYARVQFLDRASWKCLRIPCSLSSSVNDIGNIKLSFDFFTISATMNLCTPDDLCFLFTFVSGISCGRFVGVVLQHPEHI